MLPSALNSQISCHRTSGSIDQICCSNGTYNVLPIRFQISKPTILIHHIQYMWLALEALELRKHAKSYCGVVWVIVSCKTLGRWLSSICTICGHCYWRSCTHAQAYTVKALNLANLSSSPDFLLKSTSFGHCRTNKGKAV